MPKEEKKEKTYEKENSSFKTDKTKIDKSSVSKKSEGIVEKKEKSSLKEDSELFEKIWKELQQLGYGYERGSDVSYLHFAEACETFCDVDDIDINEFSDKYEINIG